MNSSNQVTIDDLDDISHLEREDDGQATSCSSSDDEIPQEDPLSSESESESESESGLHQIPGPSASSFSARLSRIRKARQRNPDPSDPSESDEMPKLIQDIKALLAKENDFLDDSTAEARPTQDATGIQEDIYLTKQDKNLPPELLAAWENDRRKKAKKKESRRLARLLTNQLTPKERKKEAKRRMRDVLNEKSDISLIEEVIRDFVTDLDGSESLRLPPMDKGTRARIHELATAFNLKSKSQGKGDSRFTTLFKTSRTGIGIKEWKVDRVLGTSRRRVIRHKEGEVVGKAAPKIGEGNIGFKLLQQMGWKEGDSIGVEGGLEAPIAAIIKRSKLGLGASSKVT